jgi:hypothetical protein
VQTFLVEQYWPGVTAEAFERAEADVRASTSELAGGGTSIRFLHSTLVPGDETAFCVFAASSAELVAEAYRRAGVRFDRIVDAVEPSRRRPVTGGSSS